MNSLRQTPFYWLPFAMLAIAATAYIVPTIVSLAGSRIQETERDLRIEEQAWRKRAAILEEHKNESKLSVSGSVRTDDLQITLMEMLDAVDDLAAIELRSFQFDEFPLPSISSNRDVAVNGLRLSVDIGVSHAETLLDFLDTIERRVSPRPVEVRGCSVRRVPGSVELQADCVLDLYHWDNELAGDADRVGAQ